jgi:hypothetical protein
MLHVWLIPLLVVMFAVVAIFYFVLCLNGASPVRKEGRTLVDEPDDEPPGNS